MALTLYKLDPANGCTFDDGEGASPDAIDSVVDWSVNESASITQGTSDGVATVQGTYVDNRVTSVTITTKNPANVTANGWQVGTCGALVLKGLSRVVCDGDPVALTATAAQAKITSIDFTVPHEGDSACNITFECTAVDPDTVDIFIYS